MCHPWPGPCVTRVPGLTRAEDPTRRVALFSSPAGCKGRRHAPCSCASADGLLGGTEDGRIYDAARNLPAPTDGGNMTDSGTKRLALPLALALACGAVLLSKPTPA